MSREIKFRVWDKNNKSWFGQDLRDFINFNNQIESNKYVEIMQFTGLLDKNGKEIYEGDILRVYDYDNLPMKNEEFEVIFMKGYFGCSWIHDREALVDYLNDYSRTSEVIGNIYENKGLITGEKE